MNTICWSASVFFATEDEVKNSPKQFNDNTLPGDLKYKDQDNNGVIDNNDRVPISGRFPDLNIPSI